MTFEQWWENHGKHNAAANGGATRRAKELMQLAFEVGQEQKHEAVAAERERCAKLEVAMREALKQARAYPWASGAFILALEDGLKA